MPKVEDDLKAFAGEIEAFFKKLINKLDGDEDQIEEANDLKEQTHALAGTEPSEESEENPTDAASSSTDSSETKESGSSSGGAAA